MTSQERPSRGEATSGRAGKDGKEGKIDSRGREESEADTDEKESVSPRLTVSYVTKRPLEV